MTDFIGHERDTSFRIYSEKTKKYLYIYLRNLKTISNVWDNVIAFYNTCNPEGPDGVLSSTVIDRFPKSKKTMELHTQRWQNRLYLFLKLIKEDDEKPGELIFLR